MWRITIECNGHLAAQFESEMPHELVKWMRKQAEVIRKESSYAVPRFEGEEPLEGL